MKIDWKRKLTSRKLWLAVAGLAAGLIIAFKGSAEAAETISGIIMSVASVIAYIVGEGLVDASRDNTDDAYMNGYEVGYTDGESDYISRQKIERKNHDEH